MNNQYQRAEKRELHTSLLATHPLFQGSCIYDHYPVNTPHVDLDIGPAHVECKTDEETKTDDLGPEILANLSPGLTDNQASKVIPKGTKLHDWLAALTEDRQQWESQFQDFYERKVYRSQLGIISAPLKKGTPHYLSYIKLGTRGWATWYLFDSHKLQAYIRPLIPQLDMYVSRINGEPGNQWVCVGSKIRVDLLDKTKTDCLISHQDVTDAWLAHESQYRGLTVS